MLATISLVAVLSVLPELTDPPPVGVTGTARLTCQSRWHQIDAPLASGKKVSRGNLARLFAPPPGAGAGDRAGWEVRGADARDLLLALHDHPWDAGEQSAAYARWLGDGPGGRKLTAEGVIKVTRTGDRLAVAGTVRATDEGVMSNRFGPNNWRDEWEHRFEGEVRVGPDGRVRSLDLRDEFKVAGVFGTPGGEDRSTRSGTFRLTSTRTESLSAEEQLKLRRLLGQLGADEFDARQRATEELIAWGRVDGRVAARLRALGGDQADPELGYRLKAIRRQLPGE